jgi:zinc protease
VICLFRLILTFFVSGIVWATPEIDSWRSEHGVPVYFVNLPEIEMIDLELTFDAGSARDGQLIGISNLVNQMLLEGTTELDVEAFNRQLGLTGASISVGSSKDTASVSMRSLVDPEKLRPAFNLLRDVIGSPRFDSIAIERTKARVVVELQYRAQSPASRASDRFASLLYGSHPYASRTLGDETSVRNIRERDIVRQYETYYVRQNMVIAIVGNVAREVAEELANELSNAVPLGVKAKTLPFVEKQTQAVLERVDFPSIQSHVRIGGLGVERTHPDYFPLVVGNHALGGNGLVSLLFKRIREERGLAYSAYSYLVPMATSGSFVAVIQTDRSQEEKALQVMRDTLESVAKKGLSEENIAAAKSNLINGFPLKLDTNAEIVNYISMIGFYGLPTSYLATFQERIAAVTSEQIRGALSQYLKKDRLLSVIVGPDVPVSD